jgi:hypothetical protein
VFINFLLDDHDSFGRTASWVVFFEFIFLSEFLLFLFAFLFFLFHFGKFGLHLLFFSRQGNFNFVFFIKVLDCIRYFRKLMSFHKLTDPQSSVSKHFLFQRFLPFIEKFLFEVVKSFFVLFLILELILTHFLSMLVHFKDGAVGIIGILRLFDDA